MATDVLKAVWMSNAFLEAAHQAAHEWFAEMGSHGARVLASFDDTRPVSASTMARNLVVTIDEADALAHACCCALKELTARKPQRPEDRRYRRGLAEAVNQLSKAGM